MPPRMRHGTRLATDVTELLECHDHRLIQNVGIADRRMTRARRPGLAAAARAKFYEEQEEALDLFQVR